MTFLFALMSRGQQFISYSFGWRYRYWLLFPPHPHPHPRRQQKSLARGQNKNGKDTFLMTLCDFYAKKPKQVPCQGGLKRDPREKKHRRFPERVQKVEIQQ